MTNRELELGDVDYDSYEELREIKLVENKQKTQRRLAIASLIGVFFIIIMGHAVPIADQRIEAMAGITSTAVVGLLSIVGAYVGLTTWMQGKKEETYGGSYYSAD